MKTRTIEKMNRAVSRAPQLPSSTVVDVVSPEPQPRADEGHRPSSRASEMMRAFRATRQQMNRSTMEDRVIDAIVERSGPGSLRSDLDGVETGGAEASPSS